MARRRFEMHHYRQALQRQHPCGFAARGRMCRSMGVLPATVMG